VRPDETTRYRIQQVTGRAATRWLAVSKGFTVAARWIVTLEDACSVFVKHATDEDTAAWIRKEARLYSSLKAPFLPTFIGWDDGPEPLLVLEDLSSAFWPPPWTATSIDAVFRLLDVVRSTPAPNHLPSLVAEQAAFRGWHALSQNASGFLRLGLVSDRWLSDALPTLMAAEAAAELAGDTLVHCDPRSDNVCFTNTRTLLIDWNWAARGNPKFDVLAWLPSLHVEGGPPPWEFTTVEPELIAAIAGYYAFRAWQPPHKQGPAIRDLQYAQLRSALPWAARSLGLHYP
jgi:hypothetical protein